MCNFCPRILLVHSRNFSLGLVPDGGGGFGKKGGSGSRGGLVPEVGLALESDIWSGGGGLVQRMVRHYPPVDRMTDTCKSITFPQLRLRALKNS